MRMTYRIAYSLGLDAANRQMSQDGRTAWNEEDAALASHTLNTHLPLCNELPGINPAVCGCSQCVPISPAGQACLPFKSSSTTLTVACESLCSTS